MGHEILRDGENACFFDNTTMMAFGKQGHGIHMTACNCLLELVFVKQFSHLRNMFRRMEIKMDLS